MEPLGRKIGLPDVKTVLGGRLRINPHKVRSYRRLVISGSYGLRLRRQGGDPRRLLKRIDEQWAPASGSFLTYRITFPPSMRKLYSFVAAVHAANGR